ncbi:bifunctional diaminohydroxyphosphoribosylaminopyrimidine deaminase/5-amino-6-(5-phosphoribosylamino)uracil reductase RibD [bacterium]|nr:bifunctional diaminohydroxyphosphoribosylaminopyrimidine deaminase/5-amino-6-(5-phosphoribosylamino)uracil reductase RibD [bacterium]
MSSVILNDVDAHWLGEARTLAERGRWTCAPNPMVGAIVLAGGKPVGSGFHMRRGEPHAEVIALREAGEHAAGATLYVTLEPCSTYGRTPPCAYLVVRAGIKRVVIGATDPNPAHAGRGIEILREHALDVVCAEDPACVILNEKFTHFITTRTPFVNAKWAMTLDGRIATRTGSSRWISCEDSRTYTHLLRSEYDAVMVGAGTVLADDPLLNVRLEGDFRQPARIAVDHLCRITQAHRIVTGADDPRTKGGAAPKAGSPACIVACGRDADAARMKALEKPGVQVWRIPEEDGPGVDLKALLARLGEREISSVLVEGGGTLLGSLFDQRLVHRVSVFIAPKLIGGAAAPGPVGGAGIESMADALNLSGVQSMQIGSDTFITGRVSHPE